MATIDVLLATYNGERYLPALLASLAAQTLSSFRILARDDGSRDGTLQLLQDWQRSHPGRMEILDTDVPSGSAVGNFNRLMAASDADYVLFADQDDIWHADKVQRTVAALMDAEAGHGGARRPAMALCDLALVDGAGQPLFPSFRAFQGLDVSAGLRLNRLLFNNVVTGCAMGINRAALLRSAPVPKEAHMHDWWMALVCVVLGTVHVMPEVLIDYRQHANNVVGAQRPSLRASLGRLLQHLDIRENRRRYRAWLSCLRVQAGALLNRYGSEITDEHRMLLKAFLTLQERSWPRRVVTALRHDFTLPSLRETFAALLRL